MDFLSPEFIEKYLSIKDLVTISIVYFASQKKVTTFIDASAVKLSEHFKSIENTLKEMSKNINELKTSIINLEVSQTKKTNDLTERVTNLENKFLKQ